MLKHSDISGLKSLNVGNLFFKSLGSSETRVKPTSSLQTVDSMIVPVSALQVEDLWVVKNDFSLCLCLGLNDPFKSMFPNSEIAKTFKLNKTKCQYLISYALAPFLKDVLLKSINTSQYFVILHDESKHEQDSTE